MNATPYRSYALKMFWTNIVSGIYVYNVETGCHLIALWSYLHATGHGCGTRSNENTFCYDGDTRRSCFVILVVWNTIKTELQSSPNFISSHFFLSTSKFRIHTLQLFHLFHNSHFFSISLLPAILCFCLITNSNCVRFDWRKFGFYWTFFTLLGVKVYFQLQKILSPSQQVSTSKDNKKINILPSSI